MTMLNTAETDVQNNGGVCSDTESCKNSQASEKDAGHDIEEVYKVIGFGRVQCTVLLVGGLCLLMMINETIGMGIIAIASQCDFQTNSVDKSILSSASLLGIASASFFCGYLSDTVGRRSILLYTTLTGNLLAVISMFLPTYWPFVIFRFLIGVFISGASSSIYTYIGEFFSAYYRPIVINYASSFLGFSLMYFPAISWLILTMDWSLYISDGFSFRPWRLIPLFMTLPGLIASIILIFLPETPKFYLSVNRPDDAYAAADWVCRHSKGKTLADLNIYKIKAELHAQNENLLITAKSSNILIKMWKETIPLLKRPHVVNFLLCSIIMAGLYISSSGMGVWYPIILNRVDLSEGDKDSSTVCQILEGSSFTQKQNSTMVTCDDTITKKTYIDTMTMGVCFVIGYIILGVIVNPLGRKRTLIGILGISSIFGIILIWIKGPIFIVVSFLMFLVLPGVGISVLSGVIVELMPTHLRAKAVCIILMMGRFGSILGSSIIGAMIETHCVLTFSFFGVFGFVCAALVFLLPI